MKRTPLKQVGKIGRANSRANKKIERMAIEKDIHYCEVCPVLAEILGTLSWQCLQSHSNAHRHSRYDYRGNLDMLSDFKQWVFACQYSHTYIDDNPKIREQVFIKLRGEDNL